MCEGWKFGTFVACIKVQRLLQGRLSNKSTTSVCVMDSRRSRRRERERRLRALETAEQKEARLAKRRLRDRAQRVSQSTVQRERTVQQRRERLIHETPENRQTRLLRMRQRTSHSSSFRFMPAISRQLDKTIDNIYLRNGIGNDLIFAPIHTYTAVSLRF